jgi:Tfp pilus assembly protein PilP
MSRQKNKYLNLALVTIAAFIWFYVFFRIILPENNEEKPLNDLKKTQLLDSKGDTKIIPYGEAKLKDPFRTLYNTKRQKKQENKPKRRKYEERYRPPDIRLLGIISDNLGKMAIIQLPDNQTYFVRNNDIIQGVKIISISKKELIYIYEKRKGLLTL